MDESVLPEGQESEADPGRALFYINPFNRGTLFTHNEIEAYIKQMKLPSSEGYFQPCDNITIMKRVFGELINLYQQQGNLEKVEELKKLASAL
jgi:regulator of sirC expression with transglutaminase-like and TPR domain